MKRIILLSIYSAILSSFVSILYISLYYGKLIADFSIADFSESVNMKVILMYNSIAFITAGTIYFGLSKLVKKEAILNFIFNFLTSLVTISLVFVVLKTKDPVFKNEDAQLFIDYYKGFIMPLLFIPALSWFTLKPIVES